MTVVAGQDGARFVSKTIADGTQEQATAAFTQIWTMRNSGTSTWTTGLQGYTLNFESGSQMGAAQTYVTLANPVAPGGTATFSVAMTAPSAAGTYTGTWRMHAAAATGTGTPFGDPVTVQIVVPGTPVNQPPAVGVVTPSGMLSGNITINYSLFDDESDACSIQVQYSPNGGTTWYAATQGSGGNGTSNLTSLPLGSPHTYVWNSLADIGSTNNSNVKVRITASDAGGAGSPATTGVFTVLNQPVNPPELTISDASVTEGNSGTKTFTFTVSMSGTNSQGASVSYATAPGTATAGTDYVTTSGMLYWPAGDTSPKTINVTVNGDTTPEPNETFFVNLSSPTNATISVFQGLGTILNDDIALPSLAINNVSSTEGDSGTTFFTFRVFMSGTNTLGASVNFATSPGSATAGTDYLTTSGTRNWPAGDTSPKTINVTVNGDTTPEPDETFYVSLSSPTNATISNGLGVGTIVNDDGAPPSDLAIAFELLKDINPGGAGSAPGSFLDFGGMLYFAAEDGTSGRELWKSDGTEAGTVLFVDIWPGGDSSSGGFTRVGDIFYFSANDGTSGTELWQSDGTVAGTFRVKDIRPGSGSSNPANLTNVGGILYFSANDGTTGHELWSSDGTSAGTFRIKDIRPGSSGSSPNSLIDYGGTLYFSANDGMNGWELWRSDGTAATTALVKDINPGSSDSGPGSFVNFGGMLYFAANDGTTGGELWTSDGTPAGTELFKDIRPASPNSSPGGLTKVGDEFYFWADDGTFGSELWKSDGTPAGTVRVKDIWPGHFRFISWIVDQCRRHTLLLGQ